MYSNHFDDGTPPRRRRVDIFMTEQTQSVANGFAALGLAPELLAAVVEGGRYRREDTGKVHGARVARP